MSFKLVLLQSGKPKTRELLSFILGQVLMSNSLETTQAKLQILYAKQGRSKQFANQAARDAYLTDEIKSLKAYEKTQQKRVDDLRKDVEGAKTQLAEAMARSEEGRKADDERRDKLRQMGEEVTETRKRIDVMQEQRK
jgi:structural maintenance of chromosome 3 (chondroitin sulfate proteoglycan 6)